MGDHPLFSKRLDETSSISRRSKGRVTQFLVVDFILGPVPVRETPHYLLARDIVHSLSTESSALYYMLYRRRQFGFSATESEIDLEYFRQKIRDPSLEMPILVERRGRRLVVVDGFHRLAIAAAYGEKWVWFNLEKSNS